MPGTHRLLGHHPTKPMSKKLPSNCVIEPLDYDRKDRAFRMVFQSEEGEDYQSEVYYPGKGQRLKSAAYEICARYGWLEFPPATGVLTKEELMKLDDLVDNAMDAHPERYVPDPEKAWRDMFDWDDDAGEFYMDGNDLLACGDPPILPSSWPCTRCRRYTSSGKLTRTSPKPFCTSPASPASAPNRSPTTSVSTSTGDKRTSPQPSTLNHHRNDTHRFKNIPMATLQHRR